jgi:hypothetical protein
LRVASFEFYFGTLYANNNNNKISKQTTTTKTSTIAAIYMMRTAYQQYIMYVKQMVDGYMVGSLD